MESKACAWVVMVVLITTVSGMASAFAEASTSAKATAGRGEDDDPKNTFAAPPLKYAPRPFWFWNNTTVTEAGIIEQMQASRDQCGYGGFGILPFGKEFKPTWCMARL